MYGEAQSTGYEEGGILAAADPGAGSQWYVDPSLVRRSAGQGDGIPLVASGAGSAGCGADSVGGARKAAGPAKPSESPADNDNAATNWRDATTNAGHSVVTCFPASSRG